MSPSLATRTWGRASPTDLTNRRPLIVLVVLGLIVGGLLVPRLGLPRTVPPLTVDNPTPYSMLIEASNDGSSGWSAVSLVAARRTDTETGVVDEGSDWNLRFTSQGVELTGYHVTRAELAANDWHYTVPPEVSRRLAAAGAPPSP
jgi:hypothetical protein